MLSKFHYQILIFLNIVTQNHEIQGITVIHELLYFIFVFWLSSQFDFALTSSVGLKMKFWHRTFSEQPSKLSMRYQNALIEHETLIAFQLEP